MTRATKTTIRKLTELRASMDAAQTAVFRHAPSHDARFQECYDNAPRIVRESYTATRDALELFETHVVTIGQGWRGRAGTLYLNT